MMLRPMDTDGASGKQEVSGWGFSYIHRDRGKKEGYQKVYVQERQFSIQIILMK